MDFNFDAIKDLKKNEDAIFDLCLKYKLNSDTSLGFVKNFLLENNVLFGNNGVKAIQIYSYQQVLQIMDRLEEGKEYVRKMEKSLTKEYLKKMLKGVNTHDNMMRIIQMFQDAKEKECVYITPMGVVRLMEDDCNDFHNEELNAFFYQIMLLCSYEKNIKENIE